MDEVLPASHFVRGLKADKSVSRMLKIGCKDSIFLYQLASLHCTGWLEFSTVLADVSASINLKQLVFNGELQKRFY